MRKSLIGISTLTFIVIGVATAVPVLDLAASTPVNAQAPLVALQWSGPNVGGVVNVGDSVTLTATQVARGPIGRVEIQGRRLKPFWSVLQTCSSLPCQRIVHSDVPGTFRFRAVRRDCVRCKEVPSAEITVTWDAVGNPAPGQLILEVHDKRVAVKISINGNSLTEVSREWKGAPSLGMGSKPQRASPPGVNWTAPVSFRTAINAHVWLDAPLPKPWSLQLRDKNGVVCGPERQECVRTIGPRPDARADSVEAQLCRSTDGWCSEPWAININWQ